MLHQVTLHNVGVAPDMAFDFAERLNVITGDNGLGKSFILDVAWWAMTRTWPAQVNPSLVGGKMARPFLPGEASISFTLDGKTRRAATYECRYGRQEQAWLGASGRPLMPGLVLYAMADGSFAVWDPARNYWQDKGGIDVQDRMPAYVFNPSEIWNGLYVGPVDGRKCLSRGFLADVDNWRLRNGDAWKLFSAVLSALSPQGESLAVGDSMRIDLEESRDIPTIRSPYVGNLPVVYASAAMKRILALAYCLVWAWQEHLAASAMLDQLPQRQIIFLIDEIEQHLHPKWQRLVTCALMQAVQELSAGAAVQLLVTTHSPLVMTSCEDVFEAQTDRWLDLDCPASGSVTVTSRTFVRLGTPDSWLKSQAFDLPSTRSPETADLLRRAHSLLEQEPPDRSALDEMARTLAERLGPLDDDLFLWRALYLKKKEQS